MSNAYNSKHPQAKSEPNAIGYFIGSGASESAGKQLAAGRITGPGMRWHVTEITALLKLRCLFLEHSWLSYWTMQGPLAA